METKLPTQYNTWYQFWLDVKDLPEVQSGNYRKITVPQGGVAFSAVDQTVTWLEFDILLIKANAFDEVSEYLPTTHNELAELVSKLWYAQPRPDEKPKLTEFHNLIA